MAAQSRQPDHSLTQRLFSEYYRFSFFKAVALLESLHPECKPLGEALVPAEEAVRFKVKPGFGFPPSDISGLVRKERLPAVMEVAFMGLIGPSGTLPHWYNELAQARTRQKDHSLTAFLDIFHHRLVSLFYLAWKRQRFAENYRPGATDRLSGYLLSLIGLGTPRLKGKIGFRQETLAYFTGLLSRSVPAAESLSATVAYFTGCRVGVRQFIERMLPISRQDRTRLGQANARLGEDAVCGGRFRDCQSSFGIDLGPVSYKVFMRFLPGGDLHGPTFSLIRFIVGTAMDFNIRLVLKRTEVPPCTLGGQRKPASPRLGWSTWIRNPKFVHSRHPGVTVKTPKLSMGYGG